MKSFFMCTLFLAPLVSCSTNPVYIGNLSDKVPLFQSGSKVAIFSFLMREVSVSNSQGINWIGKHTNNDYTSMHAQIEDMMQKKLKCQIINPDTIKNLGLYKDGYFPLSEKFYLNSLQLPIVSSQKEEEIMLRTFNNTGADYYITVLINHSVQKNILLAMETDSELTFQLYHKTAGLIYQKSFESSSTSLPYDRTADLGTLKNTYIDITNQALNNNNNLNLQKLGNDLVSTFPIVETRIEH